MPVTTTPRILTSEEALGQLRALRTRQPVKYWAFYSSQLGGIVTDPALMVAALRRPHGASWPRDLRHRGHRGRARSTTSRRTSTGSSAPPGSVELALPCSRDEMREIIVRTAAASGKRDGSIRYWISAGPGSLGLPPAAGAEPGFFVMIFAGLAYPETWNTEGLRVMTTTYPIKPPLYAITKSTNYLPNVLMQMEAQEAGLDNGVFVDADGHVGESSNMNVAFVGEDGVLRHPKFDHILSGCTSLRLLDLARRLRGGLLRGVEVCDIPVAEARAAREMLLIGSSVKVAPIVEWDRKPIGDGKPGPVARALRELLEQDMRGANDRLIDIPY